MACTPLAGQSVENGFLAAAERRDLCRCWVGTARFPARQITGMVGVDDMGKLRGITPRHNPNRLTSQLTPYQMEAQVSGIIAGKAGMKRLGVEAPIVAIPPTCQALSDGYAGLQAARHPGWP